MIRIQKLIMKIKEILNAQISTIQNAFKKNDTEYLLLIERIQAVEKYTNEYISDITSVIKDFPEKKEDK